MFTGLIKKTGKLLRLERVGDAARLTVSHSPWDGPIESGESIAVQGICLTVTIAAASETSFDVLHETLKRTTLGEKQTGDILNLERAMTLNDRLGGHIVTGHIDGMGVIRNIKHVNRDWIISVVPDMEMSARIVEKGSVAIDGVSLTVATVSETSFDVHIIPTTGEGTSLKTLKTGDKVNLELDIIGKYVESYLKAARSSGVTVELLNKSGFIR